MLVLPLVPGRPQAESSFYHAAGFWASIFPGVWNFMLGAAESAGLGSAWTTVHLMCEREAADLLAIPPGSLHAGRLVSFP